MGRNFDVVIVGGGPAGAAAALSLARQGATVTLVEASLYEGPRLGEALSAESKRPLEQLQLWDKFERQGHCPQYTIQSAWGSPRIQEHHSICNPYGPGWTVDRSRFDAMLTKTALERGVRVIQPTMVTGVVKQSIGFRIHIEREGRPILLEACYLVDATGRRATLARKLGRRSIAHDRLVGVVRYLAPASGALFDPALLVESVEKGWWYSAPLPDGRLVAVFMTDLDIVQRSPAGTAALWDAQRHRAPHTAERLATCLEPSEVTVRAAHFRHLDRPAGEGFAAVGDAAMAVDPLSGRGVYTALCSGIDAATAIVQDWEGDTEALSRYGKERKQHFAECLDFRARYYGMETRWPDCTFWQRRHPES